MFMTISFINLLLPLVCLVNHIRTNSLNYEKVNSTCEQLAAENTSPSNLYYNKLDDVYLDNETSDTNEVVTIGFLGAYGQAQVLLGALPLAVEAVNSEKSKFYFFK